MRAHRVLHATLALVFATGFVAPDVHHHDPGERDLVSHDLDLAVPDHDGSCPREVHLHPVVRTHHRPCHGCLASSVRFRNAVAGSLERPTPPSVRAPVDVPVTRAHRFGPGPRDGRAPPPSP